MGLSQKQKERLWTIKKCKCGEEIIYPRDLLHETNFDEKGENTNSYQCVSCGEVYCYCGRKGKEFKFEDAFKKIKD